MLCKSRVVTHSTWLMWSRSRRNRKPGPTKIVTWRSHLICQTWHIYAGTSLGAMLYAMHLFLHARSERPWNNSRGDAIMLMHASAKTSSYVSGGALPAVTLVAYRYLRTPEKKTVTTNKNVKHHHKAPGATDLEHPEPSTYSLLCFLLLIIVFAKVRFYKFASSKIDPKVRFAVNFWKKKAKMYLIEGRFWSKVAVNLVSLFYWPTTHRAFVRGRTPLQQPIVPQTGRAKQDKHRCLYSSSTSNERTEDGEG